MSEASQPEPARRSAMSVIRAAIAGVLLILATLVAIASPVAVWGRNIVLDTDRYSSTVEPLANDPAVQRLVISVLNEQFATYVSAKSLATGALPDTGDALVAPLAGAITGLIDSVVTQFVEGPQFPALWATVNRTAHTQIVAVLTGNGPDGIDTDDGHVVLDLAPLVTYAKKQLVAAGLTVANSVPVVGATIEIAQIDGVEPAQKLTRLMDRAANWLPLAALVLYALAIAVARRRARTALAVGLSLAGSMLLLGAGITVGRFLYLDGLDGSVDTDTARRVFDTVAGDLRIGVRTALGVGLLIALGAWLAGSPRAAGVLAAHRRAAILGVLLFASTLLVLWTNPSAVLATIVGGLTVVALIAIAMVRRPRELEPDPHPEPEPLLLPPADAQPEPGVFLEEFEPVPAAR